MAKATTFPPTARWDRTTVFNQLVNPLVEKGWELRFWNEGCLLDGDFILQAPDDRHYSYIVTEQYLNEWSSAYRIRKVRKVAQKYFDWINKFESDKGE